MICPLGGGGGHNDKVYSQRQRWRRCYFITIKSPTIATHKHKTQCCTFCLSRQLSASLSMQPNKQHKKKCAPVDPVITVNKFNTWMCCCTYSIYINQSCLTLFFSDVFSPCYIITSLFPGVFWSFALSPRSPRHPVASKALRLFYSLPVPLYSHPFLPAYFTHLSDLSTCIMHGEGKNWEETCLWQ